MESDRGPTGARNRSAEREGQLRTCLPARVTTREREREARDGGAERQETVDQDWNVVRGED
ncbi:hypothetical protein ACFUN8_05770 [Streptomyces sp. NPDC057307]|uniref:hypothetical protein n=1 Tax=Streptomyces sp. NPDC057307 TaxID=3346096 RepID=UPI00363DDEBD